MKKAVVRYCLYAFAALCVIQEGLAVRVSQTGAQRKGESKCDHVFYDRINRILIDSMCASNWICSRFVCQLCLCASVINAVIDSGWILIIVIDLIIDNTASPTPRKYIKRRLNSISSTDKKHNLQNHQ